MMKKWFLGILLAVASLLCSTVYAVGPAMSEPIVSFDVVATVDAGQVDSGMFIAEKNKITSANIGAGSGGIIATALNVGCGGRKAPYTAPSNHKVTDNVTASTGQSFEVGWRS